ncbi:MAG: citramalate synthase [Acidimicrobiia bacterium]|nr:citramalate synthase [Acidimicrobiia bacterium]MDH4307165.1 citramalate synthase [Acidimicrobiia bacterium]MDH5293498.1 citramalate synthase [Acidimicrobiia bacterium]
MTSLEIYDTTLRDGSQQEGISLTVSDKLRIAKLLDDLGVGYVEGGWPGALPKDDEFFKRARTEIDFKHATLTAFGSTRRPRVTVTEDPQLDALLAAETEVICIVGKAWDYHVLEALRTDLDEGLAMVGESIEYLKRLDRRVFFDAEHFFDGYRSDRHFSMNVLRTAYDAGAERLVLCDTNGGTLPHEVERIVEDVMTAIPGADIGVHFHNDAGTAVASSLAAVHVGARQIQGCVNGYGERTGNADLCAVIPDLAIKMGIPVVSDDQLAMLAPISHHVAEVVNITLDPHRPYVGSSAFTHKAGLHTSALARRPDAYEHTNPVSVGNRTRMLVSEQAGKASIFNKASELGLDMDDALAKQVLDQVKELEHNGYHFEAADGSFELLVRRATGWEQTFFELESFRTFIERRADEAVVAEATVKVHVGGVRRVTTGEGDGPVHALDQALRAALLDTYPAVGDLRLTDFRVRVLDSSDGTAAKVRVLIETSDHEGSWGTIGVHENIIEASWEALADGIVVGLLRA